MFDGQAIEMRFSSSKLPCTSSISSFSRPSSSLPWISPLHHPKQNPQKPDPLPSTPTSVSASTLEQESSRKPRFITHERAIDLIKHEKDPQRALEIFNKVSEQKGFSHNNATYATILQRLAKSKKFNAVDAILRQMKYEPCRFHEGIFINLMKHFSKCCMHERVVEMFNVIQPYARERPSLNAISTCLNLLVESNQMNLAQKYLLNAKKCLNLNPNTCIFNILVKHHCRHGALESAFEVVKEMRKSSVSYPNLITYTTLMDGLCRSGRLKEAIELFEEMVSKYQIVPDALTYNILINGFCRGGKIDRAKKVMEFMRNNGCNPNVFNYTSVMNGFCKEGRIREAMEVLGEMKSLGITLDAIGYTTLINFFCRDGKLEEALKLLKEMKEVGCKADAVTYKIIIEGLCRQKQFEEALLMLERLPYEGVYPDKASYRITINSLCNSGELTKVVRLLSLMLGRGFVPHYATSNEILVRLCETGKAGDAVEALFELLETGFKPEPSSWVLLIETVCRERKLLPTFVLLDQLTEEREIS